ncbi:MAG: GspH/FimT family pseudopilin [Gammaproteobacteria bacterium]
MRVNRGFTLIELAVVLFIMVLGFGVVGINLSSGHRSTEFRAAARDMVSALRYARGQALIRREQTTVTIDFSENTYQISTRDRIYQIPEGVEATLVTAQTEMSGYGMAGIRFFPDGSSTGGRLTLERDQSVWRIDINWLTGQIELTSE